MTAVFTFSARRATRALNVNGFLIPFMQPLVILNTVGLTSRLLPLAPRLHALAKAQWSRPLQEVLPAVTCTAQASMLTGKLPQEHGIVGNGWLYRDTMEVRFWQQSNRLIQAEPVYATLRKEFETHGVKPFRCAKLFWWFNQGADVELSVTPKPHYGADGSKAFDIQTYPTFDAITLTRELGPFPFPSFWGPMAGLPCTKWIGRSVFPLHQSDSGPTPADLTLVYLPHLDYEPQRRGAGCDWAKIVGELDEACEPILDAVKKNGAAVWVVNEYTHVDVEQPVYLNRILNKEGFLEIRDGPFGEQLDTFTSCAFAVCDHQIAHVYVDYTKFFRRREGRASSTGFEWEKRPLLPRIGWSSWTARQTAIEEIKGVLLDQPGVARIYAGEERADIGLNHPRAGDLVVLAKPNAWFAYPFWLDDRKAPDYARTVDIHRKPGYDPCELFFDPKLLWPKGRAIAKVVMKKLGLRTLVDVIPLDASLVKGSHGLAVPDPLDKPVFIGSGPAPDKEIVPQTEIRDFVLRHFA